MLFSLMVLELIGVELYKIAKIEIAGNTAPFSHDNPTSVSCNGVVLTNRFESEQLLKNSFRVGSVDP